MSRSTKREERLKLVEVTYLTCDLCGADAEVPSYKNKVGWGILTVQIERVPSATSRLNKTTYDVCADCLKKLGLPQNAHAASGNT